MTNSLNAFLDIPQCPDYSREKQMNNHPLPEEIEEFLGNPTRSIHSKSKNFLGILQDSFFSNRCQNFIWVRILLRSKFYVLAHMYA